MTPVRPARAQTKSETRANGRVAAVLFALTGAMLGAAYAAVPFYTWFCRVTGYGGTPAVATVAPGRVIDRVFEVRFDANVHPGLPWRFTPETPSVRIRAGEVATILYRITNLADRETRGTAAYNVTPDQAAGHFNKLACFCFTEQTLAAHETIEAPVTFFVDPDADADKNIKGLASITLSYTFFAATEGAGRAASAAIATPVSTAQN
ncbi:MAG: cytochrome c oxidase assembly protein [Siculibacillus sp.]|nr:cytochrome c oxidase assembly protein [Siculibacillus sp.]